MRRMSKTNLILLLAGALSGCAAAAPKTGPDAVAAIQMASDSLEAVFKRGDADALADLLSEDAVISPIGMNDLRGREAIRQVFAGLFKTTRVSQYTFDVSEAEIYGNTAYDRGQFEWRSVSEGQAAMSTHGRYHAVWHRGADGGWRLRRLIENELPSN